MSAPTTTFVAPPPVAYLHKVAASTKVAVYACPPRTRHQQRRRCFMMLTLLAAMMVFWPIARISRFTHALRKPKNNNSTNATGAALLWDKACKNEDVFG
jgi:hypothetical protein